MGSFVGKPNCISLQDQTGELAFVPSHQTNNRKERVGLRLISLACSHGSGSW